MTFGPLNCQISLMTINPRKLFAHRVYNIHEPLTGNRRENTAQSLVAGNLFLGFVRLADLVPSLNVTIHNTVSGVSAEIKGLRKGRVLRPL